MLLPLQVARTIDARLVVADAARHRAVAAVGNGTVPLVPKVQVCAFEPLQLYVQILWPETKC